MIGTFSGMRAKMQSMSKMMKMGGGKCLALHQVLELLLHMSPGQRHVAFAVRLRLNVYDATMSTGRDSAFYVVP